MCAWECGSADDQPLGPGAEQCLLLGLYPSSCRYVFDMFISTLSTSKAMPSAESQQRHEKSLIGCKGLLVSLSKLDVCHAIGQLFRIPCIIHYTVDVVQWTPSTCSGYLLTAAWCGCARGRVAISLACVFPRIFNLQHIVGFIYASTFRQIAHQFIVPNDPKLNFPPPVYYFEELF